MPTAAASERRNEQDKTGANKWVGNAERTGSIELVGCGVDTWKPTWYVDPAGREARWFKENPDVLSVNGSWQMPAQIEEHTIGFDHRRNLIWAEGHPEPGRLAKAHELVPAYNRLREAMAAAGVPIPPGRTRPIVSRARRAPGPKDRSTAAAWSSFRAPGEAGLGRLDVTADFETPTSLYGLELLKALQAIQFCNGRSRPYGGNNMWETVVIPARNGRAILGRVYDKGVESKSAPRGRLLRAEDQRRFTAERRRAVEDIDAQFLCDRWHRRFKHFAKATEGVVTVSDPITACAVVQSKIEAGELDPLRGERLVATIMLDYLSGQNRRGDRVTLWRRRKELRELGIVTDSGVLERGSTTVGAAEPFELANHPQLWD